MEETHGITATKAIVSCIAALVEACVFSLSMGSMAGADASLSQFLTEMVCSISVSIPEFAVKVVVFALSFLCVSCIGEARSGLRWPQLIVGAVWSAAWIAGGLFESGDWAFGQARVAKLVTCFFCYGAGFAALVTSAQWAWGLRASWDLPLPRFAVRHLGVVAWIAVFVCWIPYLLVLYPGVAAPNDTLDQLQQFMGIESFTSQMAGQLVEGMYVNNHHPAVFTMLLGVFSSVGQALGSANVGLFALVLVQAVAFSGSLALVVAEAARRCAPHWLLAASTVIFALFPIFPIWAACLTKDVLFTALFLTVLVLLLRLQSFSKGGSEARRRVLAVCLAVSVLLMCLFRSTAVYLVLVVIVACIVPILRPRREAWHALLSGFVAALIVLRVVYPAVGITSGSSGEMLAVPYQQVASVVKYAPKSITERQREGIDAVLGIDTLPDRYNPINADPVKNERNFEATSEQQSAFLTVWFELGMGNPGLYGMALDGLCSSYFCPNVDLGYVWTYSFGWRDGVTGALVDQTESYRALGFDVSQGGFDQAGRDAVEEGYIFLKGTPLGVFGNMGAAFFAVTFCACCVVASGRREYLLAVFLPVLLGATLLLSPANGLLRYGLPVIASVPLLLAVARDSLLTRGAHARYVSFRREARHVREYTGSKSLDGRRCTTKGTDDGC